MKNRFNIQFEELSNKLKGHIECIQLWTNLTFIRAQDWTKQNQGWALEFEGELYKFEEQNYDNIVERLKREFQHNPHICTLENDTTQFEELATSENGWIIYLTN